MNGNLDQVRNAIEGITGVKVPKTRLDDPAEWVMIIVRTNHELDAVDGLRRLGVRAYWPNYVRTVPSRRIVAGRQARRSIRVGIIPYVLSPSVTSADIEHVAGAIDIVRTYSGNSLNLRGSDVDIIRRIDASMNTPKLEATSHNFKVGDRVRFLDDIAGNWAPGIITKLVGDTRISADVDLMGRKVPITVLPHQIERM